MADAENACKRAGVSGSPLTIQSVSFGKRPEIERAPSTPPMPFEIPRINTLSWLGTMVIRVFGREAGVVVEGGYVAESGRVGCVGEWWVDCGCVDGGVVEGGGLWVESGGAVTLLPFICAHSPPRPSPAPASAACS